MGDRVIVCCTAESWAKFVAWISIIVFAGLEIVHFHFTLQGEERFAFHVIGLISGATIVIMGCFLLVAIHNRDPAHLLVWLVAGAIFVVVFVTELVVTLEFWGGSKVIGFSCIASILFFGFSLCVVHIHKQDVEACLMEEETHPIKKKIQV